MSAVSASSTAPMPRPSLVRAPSPVLAEDPTDDAWRLSTIAGSAVVVPAETTGEDLERLFGTRGDLTCVLVDRGSAVETRGRYEVLSSQRFAAEFAGRLGFGRALYARRPVDQLPGGGETLTFSGDESLATVGDAVLERSEAHRYDDVLVLGPRGELLTLSTARLFAELSRTHAHRSLHDPLTGLANRVFIGQRIREALAHGRAALIYIDLDGFKGVNDGLGHAAGDELLKSIAHRLSAIAGPHATVARLGGDEFAVLLPLVGAAAAHELAERLRSGLTASVQVAERAVSVSASLGVAVAETPGEEEVLLRNADLAMYEAKRGGRDRTASFVPAMHAAALKRLELDHDVRHALERGELHLAYQPIVGLEGSRVLGVEALLRWRHPVRGDVAPLDFIPLAEETGAIRAIGRWVLREACEQVARWRVEHPDAPWLSVAVNVAAQQLEDPDFLAYVRTVLRDTGLEPGELALELTESAIIHDTDGAVLGGLEVLADLGVQLAIDDFGTGFSSLSRLRDLPVQILKIDRVFTTGLEDRKGTELYRGLIELADRLGMSAVAEGIETPRHLEQLRGAGCRVGQGFHLHRPLDPTSVGRLLLADRASSDAA